MKASTLRRLSTLGAASLLVFAGAAQAIPERSIASPQELLSRLKQNTQGALLNSARPNELYTAVHATGLQPLLRDNTSSSPLERADFFLSLYGPLMGIKDPLAELSRVRESKDRAGNTHVHLDQIYQGLPVFGARVVVHMNNQGVIGSNGVFVNDLEGLSITPAMSVSALRDRALAAGRKLHGGKTLEVESSRLMIYRTGLLKGVEGKSFLAYEVMLRGKAGEAIRERIILNANTGNVLNRIDEIHSVRNRAIYTPNQDVPAVLTEGSPLAPADVPLILDSKTNSSTRRGDLPQNNLYQFAGGTWQLYKNLFGADGYDFTRPATPQQQRSVYLVNDQCPNAYWNGDSTNYCPGFDADDVVSHEWSHAYTEYTHGLVYQYQSGALNESYSDIFGETYDLVNNLEGPLGASLSEGDYYENAGSRWVVGEDLSEAGAALLLRDMWDPDAFPSPSPGSVITSENYYCETGDNGGVHTNSGVSNHAYAMLVDGKTFNGVTIPAIGMTKAAHIYFQAETHHQTPTTNFPQHADALETSCRELIGVTLNNVLGQPSAEKITAADCDAVHKATVAVEFRNLPSMTVAQKCEYVPVLKPEASTPPLCGSGMHVYPTFTENWEGGSIPSGWTTSKNISGDYDSPTFAFTINSSLPAPHTGKALFAANDGDGTCAAGGDASGSIRADSPEITLRDGASFLSFTHFMQSEAGFDGGNLKYSTDGGTTYTIVPQTAFTYNEHTGVFGDSPLLPIPDPIGLPGNGNNTSPLAGEAAWTGSDQGEATGSWGTTIVDLAKLSLANGSKVKFRWEFGQDGCGGNLGWYIDDTQVYYCSAVAPPNTAPVAALSPSTSMGEAPLNVVFTLGGSDPNPGDRVVSYTLVFGDGQTETKPFTSGMTTAHAYTTAGSYTAQLTVTDSYGARSAVVSKVITVTAPSSSSGGTSSGGTPPPPPTPAPPAAAGRFGGSLGWLVLLPMFGAAALRRRRPG